MSYYDDEPRRYRTTRIRERDPDEPEYVREETYIERGKGPGPTHRELVLRGREDSVEDIPRDFPPPRSDIRRTRSVGGRRGSDDYYENDRYTDYGGAAAGGAAAGYAASTRSRRSHRSRRDRDAYSDRSDSRSPPRRERRKSGVQDMLAGLGLGGIAGAVLGKDKDKRSRSRDSDRSRTSRRSVRSRSRRGRSSSSSRSRSRGKGNSERKWAQAAQAALVAGAIEAFRSRKEPGGWKGDRGKRIATAAIGAGGIDGLIDRDPDTKKKRHLAEAVIGGLAANRLANGPRSKSRGPARDLSPDEYGQYPPPARARSRSRSIVDRFRGRSQSRGPYGYDGEQPRGGGGGPGVKELVAGGALAAAGKVIYDRVRSKSRNRQDSRSRSSSRDSYVPSRTRRRDRRQGRRSPRSDTAATRRQASEAGTARGLEADRDINGQTGAVAAGAGAGALALRGNNNNNENDDKKHISTDSSSSTEIEKKRKRMKGKELITAGLATIATIHAAHGVYSSMEAHEKRHKLVEEGEMTPEEARKKQTKAWVQDAAAVGIAALGIKGAFSEWKEMKEHRGEMHELEKRKREKRKRLAKRKAIEEREREDRWMQIMAQNPQAMYAMQGQQFNMPMGPNVPQPGMMPQIPRGPPDQSGNPYASR